MTESMVKVTIQEDPLPLVIDSATPRITITDIENNVTIIEENPVIVTAGSNNSKVVVSNGWGSFGLSDLLTSLTGKLTRIHMDPDLEADLNRLESLWIRIGNELLLTYPDGVAIQEAGRQYTDTSILDAVADINISIDGKIDIAYSYINQTASSIDQRIVSMEGNTNDRFIINESRILQTEESITSTVSRLDTIDGPGGAVELLQSSIAQTASSLDLEVSARQQLGEDLITAQSSISLISDSISLMVETVNTIRDEANTTAIILGEDGINLVVLQESLGKHQYAIGTMQSMLTNQWGVTIAEDVYGNKYATGFGLILHPTWMLDTAYIVNNKITYYDTVYICILDHTSSSENFPTSTLGTTYWEVVPEGTKSELVVSADSFVIRKPDGTNASLFDGEQINADLYSSFDGLVSLAMLDETIIQGGYIKTSLINAGAIVIGSLSGASTVIANATAGATFTSAHAGNLAYSDLVSTAMLDSTVIVGGYIKTSLINAGAIVISSLSGASTVIANATAGATFTSAQAGALAYLNSVDDGKITSISGGKISTGIISGSSSYSYWDLNNNEMFFSSNAKLKFGTYGNIYGPVTGQYIGFANDSIIVATSGLARFQVANTSAFIDGPAYVDIGTNLAGYIKFSFTDVERMRMNAYGFCPTATQNGNLLLGNSGQQWSACYAYVFYDGGGGYQDLQDDLAVMAEYQPKKVISIDPETGEKVVSKETLINPETGLEYIDLLSLPRWMTNYDAVVAKLKAENGELLSDEDITELIEDHDEAGWMLGRNISAFNDCTSGAVRQLDIETKEMYELILSRITVLENENKALKARIAALETV